MSKTSIDVVATNLDGWRAMLTISAWSKTTCAGSGMYFHGGTLVGMGMWTEFYIETGTERFPKWRLKLGDVPDPNDLYQLLPDDLLKVQAMHPEAFAQQIAEATAELEAHKRERKRIADRQPGLFEVKP